MDKKKRSHKAKAKPPAQLAGELCGQKPCRPPPPDAEYWRQERNVESAKFQGAMTCLDHIFGHKVNTEQIR